LAFGGPFASVTVAFASVSALFASMAVDLASMAVDLASAVQGELKNRAAPGHYRT